MESRYIRQTKHYNRLILGFPEFSSDQLFSFARHFLILAMPLIFGIHFFSENPVHAPLQYQMFCLQHPDQCKADIVETVAFGKKLRQDLREVNLTVNEQIKPKHDKRDIWSANVKFGDCEDYVLTKRKRLLNMGVPSGAMRVAVVDTENGERHAVLVVKTTLGDLVLDNRRKWIIPADRTRYNFLKMASNDPLRWAKGLI